MGNSLTIISRKEKEELYKDLEGKWLIELDGRKICGENRTYLLRKKEDKLYKVRQLSNTENCNVIFSIKIKTNISEKQRKEDLDKFELFLKN